MLKSKLEEHFYKREGVYACSFLYFLENDDCEHEVLFDMDDMFSYVEDNNSADTQIDVDDFKKASEDEVLDYIAEYNKEIGEQLFYEYLDNKEISYENVT